MRRNCFLFLSLLRCFSSGGMRHPCLARRPVRFTHRGYPIRKSSDHGLLNASPKLIAATPRPSSLSCAKASTIRPYAINRPSELSASAWHGMIITFALLRIRLSNASRWKRPPKQKPLVAAFYASHETVTMFQQSAMPFSTIQYSHKKTPVNPHCTARNETSFPPPKTWLSLSLPPCHGPRKPPQNTHS